MKKSGLADSPFFAPTPQVDVPAIPSVEPATGLAKKQSFKKKPLGEAMPPSNRDTTKPRHHETMVSRYHDTIIELVRKAVKEFGKEAATHRFTLAEKKAIADIIYTYKNQGIRTSENEIARIAVNFIVEDYKENGKNSVLEKALKALNG